MRDICGKWSLSVEYEDGFDVHIEVQIEETSSDYYSALLIHDSYGNNVIFATDEDLGEPPIASVATGTYRYDISVPGKLLKPGSYLITPVVALRHKGKVDRRDAAVRVEVMDTRTRRGTRQLYRSTAVVAPEIAWRLAKSSVDEARSATMLSEWAKK